MKSIDDEACMPQAKTFRGRLGLLLPFTLVLPLIIGCDKVPTFQELTGDEAKEAGKAAPQPAPNPQPQAAPAIQAQPAAAPKGPSPRQVIDRFMAKNSRDIGNGDLIALGDLPEGLDSINELDLNRAKINERGMQALANFPNVSTLDLTAVKFAPEGLEPVGKMAGLRHLTLTSAQFDSSGLEHLRGLTNLETLSLNNVRVADADLAPITALVHLKTLDLSGTTITDEAFVHIGQLTELEGLYLAANLGITGAGFVHIKGLPALKKLNVSSTRFGHVGFRHIKALTTLETLTAGSAAVTDASLKGFKGLPNLKHLSLGYNDISTNAFDRDLKGFPALETLILVQNRRITDRAFNTIKNYKNLTFLNVDGTGISKGAAHGLKQRFLKNTQIKLRGTTI